MNSFSFPIDFRVNCLVSLFLLFLGISIFGFTFFPRQEPSPVFSVFYSFDFIFWFRLLLFCIGVMVCFLLPTH